MGLELSCSSAEERTARHPVDKPSAVLAAAYLGALNAIVTNIQPLLMGALAQDYGLTDRQLGQVSSTYIGAITVAALSAPLWIRKANWRLVSFMAIVACVATFIWGATLRTFGMFLTCFCILGATKGVFGAPASAALGDSKNPDRAYGVSAAFQGVSAAAVAAPVSALVIPSYGVSGLFLTLAVLYATGLVAARWMPAAGRAEAPLPHQQSPRTSTPLRDFAPAILAAIAIACFAAGLLAFWIFVARIGAARGTPDPVIGATLSATAVASIGASTINVWLGGRLPSLAFVGAGSALICAAYVILAIPGSVAFVVCNLLFAIGWGFSAPAYSAIVRKADITNRLFVAAPAASGLAGVGAGLLTGPVIEASGYDGLLALSAGLVLSAFGAAAVALRLRKVS